MHTASACGGIRSLAGFNALQLLTQEWTISCSGKVVHWTVTCYNELSVTQVINTSTAQSSYEGIFYLFSSFLPPQGSYPIHPSWFYPSSFHTPLTNPSLILTLRSSYFSSSPLPILHLFLPSSLSLCLWLSSCPVREWVISSKLIWPLMIGSGTYSSVSDWPRDEEANFPWCSWRIVVALNYHLLCVCVCVCSSAVCVHVQECLHKCLSVCVWKELKTSGLAIMSSCSKQGRWRDW